MAYHGKPRQEYFMEYIGWGSNGAFTKMQEFVFRSN